MKARLLQASNRAENRGPGHECRRKIGISIFSATISSRRNCGPGFVNASPMIATYIKIQYYVLRVSIRKRDGREYLVIPPRGS